MQHASLPIFTGILTDLEEEALKVGDQVFPTEPQLIQLGRSGMTELLDTILNTGLEPFAVQICESFIGGFHNAAQRLLKEADKLAAEIRTLARDQDGSEVLDVQLQETITKKQIADLALRSVELIRDSAADVYTVETGETWTPFRGSVRPSVVSAALVQAREVIRADRAARENVLPANTRIIAFRAAPRTDSPTDASRIFDALNWARSKCPNMALATTGAPGGEQIAIRWARQNNIPLILEKPNFDRDGKSAPFKANDTLLKLNPVLCLTLPRSLEAPETVDRAGPVLNLGQKAVKEAIIHHEIVAK